MDERLREGKPDYASGKKACEVPVYDESVG
jgi:hypothetical protein